MKSIYISPADISASARSVQASNFRRQVPLDRANDGWIDLDSGIVSDRYISDIRVVPPRLHGAARYAKAVSLLHELRNSIKSHHPHKNAR